MYGHPDMTNTMEEIFGEAIHVYSRAQAANGRQIDELVDLADELFFA